MKKNLLGVMSGTALAIGVGVMTAPAADAFQVTLGSGTYEVEITNETKSFNEYGDLLTTNNLFWGDSDLADEFAHNMSFNQEFADIWIAGGNFSVDLGFISHMSDTGTLIGSYLYELNTIVGFSGGNGIYESNIAYDPTIVRYAYATRVPGNVPTGVPTDVPTPAAVLPGLFGMGLSALRKRRVASSEEA